jgi:hypothetical protein
VSQSLINEIIAWMLQGDRIIRACEVSLHAGNQISVHLRMNIFPWSLHLRLKLDKSVDFSSFSSPKVRAWLETHRLLAGVGAFFRLLPDWIRLYGNQVVLDLGYFPREPEQRRILELVKSAEIRTEEGKALFVLKIAAD